MGAIEKDIFPGLMMPPFHYACFTRFHGYSEESFYSVHNSFQILIGLEGCLHFELEDGRKILSTPGSVFILGPGIRHRWHSEKKATSENFMFFCDGFVQGGSELERLFSPKVAELVWFFAIKLDEYATFISNFRSLSLKSGDFNVDIMHGLLYSFLAMLCKEAAKKYKPLLLKDQHPALLKAVDIINRRYRSRLTLDSLSRECALGTSRLSELFRNSYGVSPMQYVADLRLKKASQLLEYSDMNVSQIADYLGFESVHYFSRFFKKHTGTCPSSYMVNKP